MSSAKQPGVVLPFSPAVREALSVVQARVPAVPLPLSVAPVSRLEAVLPAAVPVGAPPEVYRPLLVVRVVEREVQRPEFPPSPPSPQVRLDEVRQTRLSFYARKVP